MASDAEARGHVQTPKNGSFYGLGDFVFVPSANKRALEMEKEKKRLEEELAKLNAQEKSMEESQIEKLREELREQKRALEAKQKIEELRQAKIAEAKQREEERIRQELQSKQEADIKKKQEEERLTHLKKEIEKKRQTVPDIPVGQLPIEEAINRIKKLQSELSEIDSKIDETVKQVRLDYEHQLSKAEPGPKGEFESSSEYQQRVALAEQMKEKIRQEQAKAGETAREQLLKGLKKTRKALRELLTTEYSITYENISVDLGQYDADGKEMAVQIRWASTWGEYKTDGYLKVGNVDAKRLKDHREFVKGKGWVYILPQTLRPALLRVDVEDAAEDGWSTPVYCGFRGAISMAGTYILRFDGTIWAWGPELHSRTPIQVYADLSHVSAITEDLALQEDGTVWTLGAPIPMQVPNLAHVMAVAGASYSFEAYRLALKLDGTVWVWSENYTTQNNAFAEDAKSSLRTTIPIRVPIDKVKGIAAGQSVMGSQSTYFLALKDDGTVWEWGPGFGTPPVQAPGLLKIKEMATANHNCLAVTDDGVVWEWAGANSRLGCGIGYNKKSVQVPGLTGITAVASLRGYYSPKIALKNDGTVWAWINYQQLEQIPILSQITAISRGGVEALALKDDGTVWTWGWPYKGNGKRTTPVRISAPIQVDPIKRMETSGTGTDKAKIIMKR